MPDICLIYMTAPSLSKARELARALVAERLAACTNVLPGMISYYWWEGDVESGEEAVVIAKTRADRVDALTERVKALHDYSVPCVLALPVSGDAGNADYLAWLRAEAAPR